MTPTSLTHSVLIPEEEVPTMKTILAGGAKNHLDDLKLLNEKTTAEMFRGVQEGYLDADGATALAEKLGVEPPRVKKRFYFYFTQTVAQSIQVNAFDAEQARAEAERLHAINVSHSDIHYGSQSRFDSENSRIRRVFSELSAERPTVPTLPLPLHPWEIERHEAQQAGRSVSEWHRQDLSYTSVIPGS